MVIGIVIGFALGLMASFVYIRRFSAGVLKVYITGPHDGTYLSAELNKPVASVCSHKRALFSVEPVVVPHSHE
jgi:hypothetical protein